MAKDVHGFVNGGAQLTTNKNDGNSLRGEHFVGDDIGRGNPLDALVNADQGMACAEQHFARLSRLSHLGAAKCNWIPKEFWKTWN